MPLKGGGREKRAFVLICTTDNLFIPIVNNLPKEPPPPTPTHTLRKVGPVLPTPHPTRHCSEGAERWCVRVTGSRADGLGEAEDLCKRPCMQSIILDLAGLRASPQIRRERAPFEKKPFRLMVSPRVALEVGF